MKRMIALALAVTAVLPLRRAVAAEISLDSAPPVVVKTTPVAGATDVDAGLAEIQVTYSKAMQDGNWSWCTWSQENYPETTGKPRYLADGRTCVLPVKLQPGKFYAIWLNSEKFKNFKDGQGRAAVPYLLTFSTGGAAQSAGTTPDAVSANAAEVRTYEVNKAVAEFPVTEDLSTPETACVAWQRANANKDAQAISRLSWVPLDPAGQEAWYRNEQTRDPEGLAVYLKAVAESKIVAVQIWRGELANVVAFLRFPEGKGRAPYSARCFGRIGGEWKNLGEDRLPDLESAKANFEQKTDGLFLQFAGLKAQLAAAAGRPTAAADSYESLLNADQRLVLDWSNRQFRSFFDARTFEGWSAKERSDLETRLIDALKGPQNRDYYQAINTLAALRSQKAVPALLGIAADRREKDNRDRWMAIRALGIIGDKSVVPEFVHLVYHANVNTRWWAQISLVRLTGQNFGKDWQAWGAWWNAQNGQPPFQPEIVHWYRDPQWSDPAQLEKNLAESDEKFFASLRPTAEAKSQE